ncbi:hypothetical protein R5R35_006476 [Gryllus longicercus]|uniref:HTH CENPB-type domain-containing protein n=1 Tax=Gryllus longicercus TaxID=2509291 RepID=A0AAN9Z082_9ORTH
MSGGKWKTLTLGEKIELIEEHEQGNTSVKDLVMKFKVGKTQVYDTLKNKGKIKIEWLKGIPENRKRLSRTTSYEKINVIIWEWFVSARAEGIPISGPMIQAKAIEVAQKLGKTEFKASNGWLESFRLRNNIVFNKVYGETKRGVKTEDCKWAIPKIVEGYEVFQESLQTTVPSQQLTSLEALTTSRVNEDSVKDMKHKNEINEKNFGDKSSDLEVIRERLATIQRPVDEDKVYGEHVACELRALQDPVIKRWCKVAISEALLKAHKEDIVNLQGIEEDT